MCLISYHDVGLLHGQDLKENTEVFSNDSAHAGLVQNNEVVHTAGF